MDDFVKILAPTNNVNDTSVVIFQLLAEDGAEVKKGQAVLAVETSKATADIESPADGYIKFMVGIGDEVPNGSLLAVVAPKEDLLESFHPETKPDKAPAADRKRQAAAIQQLSEDVTSFGIFDQPVTLGEIYVKNGESTERDTILCRIRKGNHTETVPAPEAGYVHWEMEPYMPVKAGQALGSISGSPSVCAGEKTIPVRYGSLRVSREAQRILDDRKLTAAALGLTGLVTAEMVRERLEPARDSGKEILVSKKAAASLPAFHSSDGRYESISKAKRSEAVFLSEANRDAVVSQVSVLVPTQGIFTACAKDPELAGRFSSVIIFETGRLLRNYRDMLSFYEDGRLFVYDHINIGYALSIGDGLKVPVFRDADRKDLESIMAEKERFIEKYLSHALTPEDLGGGTFTITDLSSTGCYMFSPVLNLGQSAILGVGGENPGKTDYPLVLAFDHRVTDGATATEFLCRLKERLIAHENVLLGRQEKKEEKSASHSIIEKAEREKLVCDSCFRTAEELEEWGLNLVKTVDRYGEEKHICSLCLAGY